MEMYQYMVVLYVAVTAYIILLSYWEVKDAKEDKKRKTVKRGARKTKKKSTKGRRKTNKSRSR